MKYQKRALRIPALRRWIVLLLITLLSGCSGDSDEVTPEVEVGGDLFTIAEAYRLATEKNGQPPKGPDELKPFLPQDADQDALFRSVRDGEPFVIIWGTDPREGMDTKPLVIGYEKEGKGGDRFVFTAMGVMQMTDDDFAEARFPAGHKP
jgi:hypothetical protein